MVHRHVTDPDEALDTTRSFMDLHGPCDSPAASTGPSLPTGSGRRLTRRPRTATYSRDSLPGLADYFMDACPSPTWASMERGNVTALRAALSELRQDGLSPDKCRAMIDLFFHQRAGKSPYGTWVGDFTRMRLGLIRELSRTGVAKTDDDYASWSRTYQTTQAEQNAFEASWASR